MLQKLGVLICILSKNMNIGSSCFKLKILKGDSFWETVYTGCSVRFALEPVRRHSFTFVQFYTCSPVVFIFTTLSSVILFLWIGASWIFIRLHHYMLHLALSWNTQMRRVLQYSGFPIATWSAATFLGIVK